MDTTTQLFLSVIVSSFGLAYFVYGKRQKKLVPTVCGIALMVYPYFVENPVPYFAIALIGLALPFFIREPE